MRVGVIGVGIAGTSHLFDLTASDRFEVSAVCASRAERAMAAARLFSVPAYFTDADVLVNSAKIDAVVVAVPPNVSALILRTCMDAGLPTLVDKPAGVRGADFERLAAAATAPTSLARVAYNRRYQAHVLGARRFLERHREGIEGIECRWSGRFESRYVNPETYRHTCRFGDGVILDTACHIFDTLSYLGFGDLTVEHAWLGAGSTGADVAAIVRLKHGLNTPVVVRIVEKDDDDDWQIYLAGRHGRLCLTKEGFCGNFGGSSIKIPGGQICRPIDDLIKIRDGHAACGATVIEAARVLQVIDEVRLCARTRRAWLRPRAKALGRLNGSC
jgi:predicted dehydrogenase